MLIDRHCDTCRRLADLAPFLLALALLLIVPYLARAVDVRRGDPVYDFLERAEVLGYLETELSGARPYTRLAVAVRLAEADAHRDEMSRIDRARLDYHLFEFGDELELLALDVRGRFRPLVDRWRWVPDWWFPHGLDMFYVEGGAGDDWSVALNPLAKLEFYQRLPEQVGGDVIDSRVFANGGAARFRSGGFSAFGAVADNRVDSSPAVTDSVRYPYEYGAPTSVNNDYLDFYDTEAEVAYERGHVMFYLGKDRLRWGEGESGTLILNDYALPFTHFRFRGRWGPFALTLVQGKLHTEPRIGRTYVQPNGIERELFADKWTAAQRFELHAGRGVRIAFFEQVVYGERDFDIEYLNPLLFIHGQEHYTGDPDNMLLGGDIRVIALNRLKLHAQILFDEFVLEAFGSDDYSNKWAVLAGAAYEDAFGVANGRLFLEYARIRPYVYSHKYEINRYTHLGTGLGYPSPPNSDNLLLGWRQQLARAAALTVTGSVYRHGANPSGVNLGGDLRRSDQEPDARKTAPFLAGDRETRRQLAVKLALEPLLHLHTELAVRYLRRTFDPVDGDPVAQDHLLWQVVVQWYPVF
ncbi:MAG: hypothetical protein MAG453_00312 [Calditrichaeota bacterium]|nr:hypothetical protein [Calditrichota bacterium]